MDCGECLLSKGSGTSLLEAVAKRDLSGHETPNSISDMTGLQSFHLEGKGCKRTLACTCRGERVPGFPFCAAVALVRSQCSRTGLLPTSPEASKVPLLAILWLVVSRS